MIQQINRLFHLIALSLCMHNYQRCSSRTLTDSCINYAILRNSAAVNLAHSQVSNFESPLGLIRAADLGYQHACRLSEFIFTLLPKKLYLIYLFQTNVLPF